MSEKYKLNDEELENVAGGVSQGGCAYFLAAAGRLEVNQCMNCFYYHKKNNKYECDSPNVKGKGSYMRTSAQQSKSGNMI